MKLDPKLIALAGASALAFSQPAAAQDGRQNDTYTSTLTTLNDSGVSGTVTLTMAGAIST